MHAGNIVRYQNDIKMFSLMGDDQYGDGPSIVGGGLN